MAVRTPWTDVHHTSIFISLHIKTDLQSNLTRSSVMRTISYPCIGNMQVAIHWLLGNTFLD